MASFLDIGILQSLDTLFAFLLVWIITYGILTYSKIFKLELNARALIAVVIAVLTLTAPRILDIIVMITPWFSLGFIFITFVLLGLMALGISSEQISKYINGDGVASTARYWVIILGAVILLASLGLTYFSGDPGEINEEGASSGQSGSLNANFDPATGTTVGDVGGTGQNEVVATIFHPKMLGMLFIMLLAVFTVLQLAK